MQLKNSTYLLVTSYFTILAVHSYSASSDVRMSAFPIPDVFVMMKCKVIGYQSDGT